MIVGLIDIPCVPFKLPKEFEELNRKKCELENKIAENEFGFSLDGYVKKNYSIGLLTIAAYLKKNSINVIYSHYEDEKKIENMIKECSIIGISSMSPFLSIVFEIAKKIKKQNQNIKVVVGGPGPTNEPLRYLSTNNIDVAIIGEGEKTFLELTKNINNLENLKGIAFKKNGIIMNSPVEYLTGDELPTPDYSFLNGNINDYSINITTMRGCLYNCSFCAKFKGPVRFRPINDVIKELDYLNKNLEKNSMVHFSDNVISIHKKRFLELMCKISEKKYHLVFGCDVRANHVDSEIAIALNKANFKRINIGVEDCCDFVLKKNNKGLTFKEIKSAIKTLKENTNAIISAYWMIALPGTNEKTIQKNLMTIKEMLIKKEIDFVLPSLLKPYPGNEISKYPEKFGIRMKNDWLNWLNNYYLPMWESDFFDQKKLINTNKLYLKTIVDAYSKMAPKGKSKISFKNSVSI
ncbi:MAG: radical SAM protein [Candidatus ainarchaeum sp.]|nr:radical SAM protein [Candidatus ainarchaeum sp.]